MNARGKVVRATGFHAPTCGEVDCLFDTLIAVGDDGTITGVIASDDPEHAPTLRAARDTESLIDLPPDTYLLPGFVDLHIHAPQYPQLGGALDVPLEVWLQTYTFPLEVRYSDTAFARDVYALLVDDLLACGTTTAVYYGTIHDEANRLLADLCIDKGQRALIGKVAMDNPDECPDYYRDESVDAALAGTESLITHIRRHPDNEEGRVRPLVTPRFVPSCTDDLLNALGNMAAEHDCAVQTHCSESDWQHGYVHSRHGMSDTESLERFGLLRPGSVLAHANFISGSDMDRIRARQAAIAHCPLSNVYFSDAVFPLKAALDKGLRIGLGTDISGGPSSSMLESARSAVTMSRMLERGVDPTLGRDERSRHDDVRIDFRVAFHLTTAGGGTALGLPIGQFTEGYQFDAVLIDPSAGANPIRIWPDLHDNEQVLQKIIHTAGRPNITSVWVGGDQVA